MSIIRIRFESIGIQFGGPPYLILIRLELKNHYSHSPKYNAFH